MRLENPTSRNTEARVLRLGAVKLYFSYETLVAVSGPNGSFRSGEDFSNTTRKHMYEMGLYQLSTMTDKELNSYALASLFVEVAPDIIGGQYAIFPLTKVAVAK